MEILGSNIAEWINIALWIKIQRNLSQTQEVWIKSVDISSAVGLFHVCLQAQQAPVGVQGQLK